MLSNLFKPVILSSFEFIPAFLPHQKKASLREMKILFLDLVLCNSLLTFDRDPQLGRPSRPLPNDAYVNKTMS